MLDRKRNICHNSLIIKSKNAIAVISCFPLRNRSRTALLLLLVQEETSPPARIQRYFDTDRPEDAPAMCNLSVEPVELAQLAEKVDRP